MPYTLSKTSYGHRTTVSGFYPVDEITAWFAELKVLIGAPHAFGQLIDLRLMKTYPPESAKVTEESMRWIRAQGMVRSSVVVQSAIAQLQITRLAKQSGMYAYERYFNVDSDPAWERNALNWIERGVDPDEDQ
jgi:hypothetical protein